MQQIRGEPALTIQELAQRLQVARTAIVYHVRRLQRQGLVQTTRLGNRVHHLPADGVAGGTLLAALRLHNARRLVEAIRRDPSASWRSIGRSLGVSSRTVRWHLRRFESAGLLRIVEQAGRRHVVDLHPSMHPQAMGEDWMAAPRRPPSD